MDVQAVSGWALALAIIALILIIIIFVMWANISDTIKKYCKEFLGDDVIIASDSVYQLKKPRVGGKTSVIYNSGSSTLTIKPDTGILWTGSDQILPGQAAVYKWNSDGTAAVRISNTASNTSLNDLIEASILGGTVGSLIVPGNNEIPIEKPGTGKPVSDEWAWIFSPDMESSTSYVTIPENVDSIVPVNGQFYKIKGAEIKIDAPEVDPTGQTFFLMSSPPPGEKTVSVKVSPGKGVTSIEGTKLIDRNGILQLTWTGPKTLKTDLGKSGFTS